jgi:hypothetical protein
MDIEQLTMFADYRVPVTLLQLGILTYSPELLHKVHPHLHATKINNAARESEDDLIVQVLVNKPARLCVHL